MPPLGGCLALPGWGPRLLPEGPDSPAGGPGSRSLLACPPRVSARAAARALPARLAWRTGSPALAERPTPAEYWWEKQQSKVLFPVWHSPAPGWGWQNGFPAPPASLLPAVFRAGPGHRIAGAMREPALLRLPPPNPRPTRRCSVALIVSARVELLHLPRQGAPGCPAAAAPVW